MVKKILNAICSSTIENFALILCATAGIGVGIRCIIDKEGLVYTIFGFTIGVFSLFQVIIDIRNYIRSMPEEEDNE